MFAPHGAQLRPQWPLPTRRGETGVDTIPQNWHSKSSWSHGMSPYFMQTKLVALILFFFLKFHVVKYWYWYGICFVFQGCFGKSICFLFKVVLENRHPCWMEDFPKHVSSWRYEQEDEWNEFLERTDTSKVEFLCLEGWGFGLLEWNDRYLRYLR